MSTDFQDLYGSNEVECNACNQACQEGIFAFFAFLVLSWLAVSIGIWVGSYCICIKPKKVHMLISVELQRFL
jgi:hypothetical protein